MALHVTLVRNALKGGSALRPRVVRTDTVDMDSLLRHMATDTALEEPDMRAAVTRFGEALLFCLGRGEKVATPFGTFSLSAHGTYQDGETPRVENRNLGINFKPRAGWLNRLRTTTTIVMQHTPERQLPEITAVINLEAPGKTDEGKSGQIIKLRGNRLSLDPADAEQGVFLVAADGADRRMTFYSRTGSAQVDFKMADVPPGTYVLEIRTRPTGGDVWVGVSREQFTVTA